MPVRGFLAVLQKKPSVVFRALLGLPDIKNVLPVLKILAILPPVLALNQYSPQYSSLWVKMFPVVYVTSLDQHLAANRPVLRNKASPQGFSGSPKTRSCRLLRCTP
jgi:hypothetical protein